MQKLKHSQCDLNKFVLYCAIWCICKSYEEWLREVGFSVLLHEKKEAQEGFSHTIQLPGRQL